MRKKITCIICPNGCEMEVDIVDHKAESVSGASCKRGTAFAVSEAEAPVRNFATSVLVKDGEFLLASVRLSKPIPKELVMKAAKEIQKLTCRAPLTEGQILIPNILGTGSDVIVTKNVRKAI